MDTIISDLWAKYGIFAIGFILFFVAWYDERTGSREREKQSVEERKATQKVLTALSESNILLAQTLEMMRLQSEKHDERVIREFGRMGEKLTKIELKQKRGT